MEKVILMYKGFLKSEKRNFYIYESSKVWNKMANVSNVGKFADCVGKTIITLKI